MTRLYAGGTFDLFHAGHVAFLRECAKHGDVWIGLNEDDFCERYKRRPIMSYDERFAVLRAYRYVHMVIPNVGGEDSKPAIEYAMPEFIAHGDDWTGDSLKRQMGLTDEFLARLGIEMLEIPYTPSPTTSEVIERCKSQSSAPSTADTRTPSRSSIVS